MLVTERERRLAHRMDRDRASLERRGVDFATLLGFKAQQDVMRAFTHRDLAVDVTLRQRIMSGVETLRDAMVVAYLRGQLRSRRLATLSFSGTVYDEAISVLEARLEISPEELAVLAEEYEAQAIQVLHTASAATERVLQETVTDLTIRGEHVREGKKRIAEAFAAQGITPTNSFQIEAIYRTQMQIAYSAGRWQADQDEAIQEILWGYKYVTVGDDRVRDEHWAMDGMQAPKDDPIWNGYWPPNGWACRCVPIPVFEERKTIKPPETIRVRGKDIPVQPDRGFNYNPGQLLRARPRVAALKLAPRAPGHVVELHKAAGAAYRKSHSKKLSEADRAHWKEEFSRLSKERSALRKSHPEWFEGKAPRAPKTPTSKPTPKPPTGAGESHGLPTPISETSSGPKAIKARRLGREAIDDIFERFDVDKDWWNKLDFIEFHESEYLSIPGSPRAGGAYWPRSGFSGVSKHKPRIRIASGWAEKPSRMRLGKWTVDGSTAGAVRHELGHHFRDELLTSKQRTEWMQIWKGIKDREGETGLGRLLSRYGATSSEEGFAEAFGAFTNPKYGTTSRLPKAMEEFLEKLLKKRGVAKQVATGAFETLSPAERWARLKLKKANIGGSTGADRYTDVLTRKDWVVKKGARPGQAATENLANNVYSRMGVNVPESQLLEIDGLPVTAQRWRRGKTLDKLAGAELEAAHASVQKGFATDAWLGNWDVIGAKGDNILWNGKRAYRIDNGGSLFYRARGAVKDLGDDVCELRTMLDPGINPSAAEVFKGLDEAEIVKQIGHLTKKMTNSVIDDLVKNSGLEAFDKTAVVAKLKARRDWMAKWARDQKATARLAKRKIAHGRTSFDMPKATESYSHAIEVESKRRQAAFYDKYGAKDVEGYRTQATKHLEKVFEDAQPCIRINSSPLKKVVKQGRFKSQFETRTSSGCLSPTIRASAENRMFSYDMNLAPKDRPIYGYLSSSTHGKTEGYERQYGELIVRLKPAVRNRTTFTIGDSLDLSLEPTPLTKPTWKAGDGKDVMRLKNVNMPHQANGSSYIEAQYHGGLGVEDIQEVVFPGNRRIDPDLIKALDEAGISWRKVDR